MSTVNRVLAAGLAVGLVAGFGPTTAHPASAAATTSIHVAGNFVGDSRDEIFEYRPGTGLDLMYTEFTRDGDRVQAIPEYFTVTGTYTPFAGDFDGDGRDELFFFGAGDAGDFIWDFTDVTTSRQIAVRQGGLYFPVVADLNGNGIDDILWYAPGSAPDEIWEFLPGDGLAHAVRPIRNITGDYRPVPGNFTGDGGEDVIFYGTGDTADHLFDFEPGSFTPTITPFGPLTGPDHHPFGLDAYHDGWTDILFYNTASTDDPLWNFTPAGIEKHNEHVSGGYDPVAGDLFGDGYEDVFWFGTGSSVVWDWRGSLAPVHLGFGVALAAPATAAVSGEPRAYGTVPGYRRCGAGCPD